jgi:RNA polymerase sigma factor (sigma-70 family)
MAGLTADISLSVEQDEPSGEEYRAVRDRVLAHVRRGRFARLSYEDEEDLCQEALLAVCRRRAADGTVQSGFGLARKALHDLEVDRLRKKRIQTVELSEASEIGVDPNFGSMVARSQEVLGIHELLTESLDARERHALLLSAAGMRRREVAEQLDLQETQVKRLLGRARGKLRPRAETLAAYGRCRMLTLTIADIAEGSIAPDSPRGIVGYRHLALCPSCRRAAAISKPPRRSALTQSRSRAVKLARSTA